MTPSRFPELCLCRFFIIPLSPSFSSSASFYSTSFSYSQSAVTSGVIEASETLALQVSSKFASFSLAPSSFSSSPSVLFRVNLFTFHLVSFLLILFPYLHSPSSFRSYSCSASTSFPHACGTVSPVSFTGHPLLLLLYPLPFLNLAVLGFRLLSQTILQ